MRETADVRHPERRLVPEELRNLTAPWNALRYGSGDDLSEAGPSTQRAATALAVLSAALLPTRHRVAGWSEDALDLLEGMRGEWRRLAGERMPTTAELTWEGVGEAVRAWYAEQDETALREAAAGEAFEDVVGAWVFWIRGTLADRAIRALRHGLEAAAQVEADVEAGAVARAAESAVREGLASASAFHLLEAVGGRAGEEALTRLLHDVPLDVYDTAWAREALWNLRRTAYPETPAGQSLLPEGLRTLSAPWTRAMTTPDEPWEYLPHTSDHVRLARTLLAACEQPTPLPYRSDFEQAAEDQEDQDEELGLPRVDLGTVLAGVMPYASMVTRDGMAAAYAECRLLGIERDRPDDLDDFIQRALSHVLAGIAGSTFDWLARNPAPETAEPWSVEAAVRAVHRGLADKRAMQLLLWSDTDLSRRALAVIESDASLPPALREAVTEGVEL
ncbi:hypothetical protein [Streptomyces sp. NPDC001970]